MTNISNSSWGSGIQSLLQKQVASGAIPKVDQSALSSAIGDVGSALRSGTASSASGSVQDRVGSAIDNEVSSGKLTSDQASELKGLFAKAHGHMHHVHAGGGGNAALSDLLSPDGTTNADGTTSADATQSSTNPLTSVAQGAHGVIDGLASFVSSLRSAVSSNGLYGAAGSTAARIGSLLVNKFA
jgi:uncharacterized protein YjbJ (UPF0337 family)